MAPEIVAKPPTAMPDEQRDREEEIVTVGRDELHHDGAERPGHAAVKGADAEGRGLDDRAVDAHRLGGDRLVADRDHGAADASAQQIVRDQEQHQHDRVDEKIEPLILVDRQTERHVGLVQHDAGKAAGPLLERLVLQHLRRGDGERERGEGEIMALQAATPAGRRNSRTRGRPHPPAKSTPNRANRTNSSGSRRYRRRWRRARHGRAKSGHYSRPAC